MGQLCRYCQTLTKEEFDFGYLPLPNTLLNGSEMSVGTHRLKLYQCETCGLFQTNTSGAGLFDASYPYCSSVSKEYVSQCKELVVELIDRFKLGPMNSVLEIGCNDGYLMQHFQALGFTNLFGVEPVEHLAKKAATYGVRLRIECFGKTYDGQPSDVVIANNVLAHVPSVKDFTQGLKQAVKKGGVFVCEVHDFEKMIDQLQFDCIYHEHFEHYTLEALEKIMNAEGFETIEIRRIPSHGGSLRGYFRNLGSENTLSAATTLLDLSAFRHRIPQLRRQCLRDIQLLSQNKIYAYGAAAKGIQFLNYLGVRHPDIEACFEDTPEKCDKFMPGSMIPIVASAKMYEVLRPDDSVIILPWNHAKEIKKKIPLFVKSYIKTKFGFERA